MFVNSVHFCTIQIQWKWQVPIFSASSQNLLCAEKDAHLCFHLRICKTVTAAVNWPVRKPATSAVPDTAWNHHRIGAHRPRHDSRGVFRRIVNKPVCEENRPKPVRIKQTAQKCLIQTQGLAKTKEHLSLLSLIFLRSYWVLRKTSLHLNPTRPSSIPYRNAGRQHSHRSSYSFHILQKMANG